MRRRLTIAISVVISVLGGLLLAVFPGCDQPRINYVDAGDGIGSYDAPPTPLDPRCIDGKGLSHGSCDYLRYHDTLCAPGEIPAQSCDPTNGDRRDPNFGNGACCAPALTSLQCGPNACVEATRTLADGGAVPPAYSGCDTAVFAFCEQDAAAAGTCVCKGRCVGIGDAGNGATFCIPGGGDASAPSCVCPHLQFEGGPCTASYSKELDGAVVANDGMIWSQFADAAVDEIPEGGTCGPDLCCFP